MLSKVIVHGVKMMSTCLDFTDQVAVVKRLIFAAALLPPETPKVWDIVSSFATRLASAETPSKAKLFIENLHYLEPDVFCHEKDLLKELRSIVGDKDVTLGIILLSPRRVCIQCGSSLFVKADRPSRVTVYTDKEGTVSGTHYRKICKRFRSGCAFVQHYGHYSTGESAVFYNDDWEQHGYFLSTRETAFEMALLQQFDIEILIGQLSYKQRSDIYNIKHGYDRAKKQERNTNSASSTQKR